MDGIWVLDVKERPNRPEAVWVERAGEAVGRRKHSFLIAKACEDCEGSSCGDEGRVVVVKSSGGDMPASSILKAFSGAGRVVWGGDLSLGFMIMSGTLKIHTTVGLPKART